MFNLKKKNLNLNELTQTGKGNKAFYTYIYILHGHNIAHETWKTKLEETC